MVDWECVVDDVIRSYAAEGTYTFCHAIVPTRKDAVQSAAVPYTRASRSVSQGGILFEAQLELQGYGHTD